MDDHKIGICYYCHTPITALMGYCSKECEDNAMKAKPNPPPNNPNKKEYCKECGQETFMNGDGFDYSMLFIKSFYNTVPELPGKVQCERCEGWYTPPIFKTAPAMCVENGCSTIVPEYGDRCGLHPGIEALPVNPTLMYPNNTRVLFDVIFQAYNETFLRCMKPGEKIIIEGVFYVKMSKNEELHIDAHSFLCLSDGIETNSSLIAPTDRYLKSEEIFNVLERKPLSSLSTTGKMRCLSCTNTTELGELTCKECQEYW